MVTNLEILVIMKKELIYTAAVALALVSCNEEELVQVPANQVNGVLTVAFEQDGATRTNITSSEGKSNTLAWSEGDEIAVFGETAVKYTISDVEAGIFQVANGATAPTEITGVAFPYSEYVSLSENTLTMTLPSEIYQNTAGELDLPMWATVSEGNITLKHLAGVLKVNLAEVPAGYNTLTVTADKPISGTFTATTTAADPVLVSSSEVGAAKTVTVTFTAATAEANDYTLYLPLPVGGYASIVVSVTDGTNTKVLKQWTDKTVERAKVYSTSANVSTYVTTEVDLRTALKTEGTVNLGANITITEPLVISAGVTLIGNGHTIKNTTSGENARAINVNVEGNVTIKDLTVVAAGQRAINVIQKSVNLTIDKVTATAANYAVNVASSSVGSTIAINNSDITGLNAVNIAGKNTNVTIENTNITCNDQNNSESYGAISINKDATDAVVTFNSGSVSVLGDSFAGQVDADGASITIKDDVTGENKTIDVGTCVIEYGESPYYYSFSTIEAALEKVQNGETIKLIKNLTLTKTLTIPAEKNVILDLNEQTITISKEEEAAAVTDFINCGTMTVKNGSIVADNNEWTRRCIYNYGTMTINDVTFTQTYNQKGAAINNEGTMTIENATVNSAFYAIWNNGAGHTLTIKNGTYTSTSRLENGGNAYAYLVNNQNGAMLDIDGGTFTGIHGVISTCYGADVDIDGGTFTATTTIGDITGTSHYCLWIYNPSPNDVINVTLDNCTLDAENSTYKTAVYKGYDSSANAQVSYTEGESVTINATIRVKDDSSYDGQ